MSEADGLRKLTEFLNQTRRQAETVIDVLNEKIGELQKENELCLKMVEQLENERDYYKNCCEQLKIENSTKWKLQERDDWRSLVDSIQADRTRLQEQYSQLEIELTQSREEIATLNDQIQRMSAATTESANTSMNSESVENGHMRTPSPPLSPVLDRSTGNVLHFPEDSPKAVAKFLKLELRRTQSQLDEERRLSEQTQLAQSLEITRLREELNTLVPHVTPKSLMKSTRELELLQQQMQSIEQRKRNIAQKGNESGGSWLNPLGIVSYWFSSPPSNAKESREVLHV